MATTSFLIERLNDNRLDSLVRELCTAEILNGRYLIQIPIVSSVGSAISVSVWPEGGSATFLVSDDGLAYSEIVNALASERVFSRVAKSKSAKYGADFDGGSMLFIRVPRESLRGAIIAMASLTKEVIDETIERSFASKFDESQEQFVRAASLAFAAYERREHAVVYGRSTTAYEFDLLVRLENKCLAFEYFTKSGQSINAAFVAFSDVSRLEDGPRLIGVTKNLQEVGPKLTLISSVASVIEASAGVDKYQRLAA